MNDSLIEIVTEQIKKGDTIRFEYEIYLGQSEFAVFINEEKCSSDSLLRNELVKWTSTGGNLSNYLIEQKYYHDYEGCFKLREGELYLELEFSGYMTEESVDFEIESKYIPSSISQKVHERFSEFDHSRLNFSFDCCVSSENKEVTCLELEYRGEEDNLSFELTETEKEILSKGIISFVENSFYPPLIPTEEGLYIAATVIHSIHKKVDGCFGTSPMIIPVIQIH